MFIRKYITVKSRLLFSPKKNPAACLFGLHAYEAGQNRCLDLITMKNLVQSSKIHAEIVKGMFGRINSATYKDHLEIICIWKLTNYHFIIN